MSDRDRFTSFIPGRVYDHRTVKAPLDPRAHFRRGGSKNGKMPFTDSRTWCAVGCFDTKTVWIYDSHRAARAGHAGHKTPTGDAPTYFWTLR